MNWKPEHTLRGYATSPDGGEITGTNLRWYSDRDGFLGTGNTLNARITTDANDCSGVSHTITLQATDSRGVVTTTTRHLSFIVVC